MNVRFGSKADIPQRKGNVRFTPRADVLFVPKADIGSFDYLVAECRPLWREPRLWMANADS
jgi:hypothetical protein